MEQCVVLAKGVSFVSQEAESREIRYKEVMPIGLASVAKAAIRLRKLETKNGI